MIIDGTEKSLLFIDGAFGYMDAVGLDYEPQGIYIRIDKTFLTERIDGELGQQTVKEWLKALIKESVEEVMRGEE